MKIIAIDPSLTCTAIATWVDGDIDTLTIKSRSKGAARLADIRHGVDGIAHDARLVLIEGYAHGRHQRAHYMGELGGALRLWAWDRKIPQVDVAPTSRAKLATGRGNAGKEEVLAETIRRLDYQGHSNDVADALWILQAALIHYGLAGAVTLPQKHLEALKKIDFPPLEVL